MLVALAVWGAGAPAAGARPAESGGLPAAAPPLSYRIDARVDPRSRRFEGTVTVTLGEAGFAPPRYHFYLNAFAHEGTTWMRTAPPGRDAQGLLDRGDDDPWGYLEPTRAECAEGPDAPFRAASMRWVTPADGNALDRTLLALDEERCGDARRQRIGFRGRFPVPIARTGGVEGWLMGAQWFPKLIGVQDRVGPSGGPPRPVPIDSPFFGPTEFFANFADYEVRLDAPAGWTVAATGQKVSGTLERPPDAGFEGHRFRARWVHDFAFLVARKVSVATRRHTPAGEGAREVAVQGIVPERLAHQLPRMLDATVASLDVLGRRVGPFPYPILTVLGPPFPAARTAGMEYPTFIVGLFADPLWDWLPDLRLLEATIAHEFAHQYFYGLVATNELDEAWLDEGFTEYWTWEILRARFGPGRELGSVLGRPVGADALQRWRTGGRGSGRDEPSRVAVASFPSRLAPPEETGTLFYRRPSTLLRTAAQRFGQPQVDRLFRRWVARERFRHPTGQAFRQLLEEVAPRPMARMLVEGLAAPAPPDVAITRLSSRPWRPPRGVLPRAPGRAAPEEPAPEDPAPGAATRPPSPPGDPASGGLGPEPEPGRGHPVLIHEPGAGAALLPSGVPVPTGLPAAMTGGVASPVSRGARVRLHLPWVVPPGAPDGTLWETEVDLRGPGLRHWPTSLALRFQDGALLRQRWDGRSPHRRIHLVTPAPLVDARLTPWVADATPEDDGRRRQADAGLVADWTAWVAGVVHWVAAGLLGAWL